MTSADPYDITEIAIKFDNLSVEALRQIVTFSENAEVTFIKANGEVRVMQATLNPAILDENAKPYASKSEKKRQDAGGVLVVWDLEKNGWRSIRAESVTQINYLGSDGTNITLQKGVVVGK